MKKYVKPELFFESFELNQQIAACNFDLVEGTFDKGRHTDCKYASEDIPGATIFMTENGCNPVITSIEGYCYQNSTSGRYGIFNS